MRERTGGNPFFIEEIVHSLVESGSLVGKRGAYRLSTPVDRLEIPPTVHGILAARIDRLPEREKSVLQTAAAIGLRAAAPGLRSPAGRSRRCRHGVARRGPHSRGVALSRGRVRFPPPAHARGGGGLAARGPAPPGARRSVMRPRTAARRQAGRARRARGAPLGYRRRGGPRGALAPARRRVDRRQQLGGGAPPLDPGA